MNVRATISIVLPYVAYLRVYEPLAAFAEPERSYWAAYADSPSRPRRVHALQREHAEALRRLITAAPGAVPVQESGHAYVRRAGGITYICPWQTRLRSWRAMWPAGEPAALGLVPRAAVERAGRAYERWRREHSGRPSPHILTATWEIPPAWFTLFDAAERRLVLGRPGRRPAGGDSGGQATAADTRILIYVTSMAESRWRTARAMEVIRRTLKESFVLADVEGTGRWLDEFHPHALVELDYGGLVHLLDDAALSGDQSVAEMAVALTGLETGRTELAMAMYQRLVGRWRQVRARERAT